MTNIHTEAKIKGGMPILVEATVLELELHIGSEIDQIDLLWPNTNQRTTERFDASLSNDDWNLVRDAVWNAYNSR